MSGYRVSMEDIASYIGNEQSNGLAMLVGSGLWVHKQQGWVPLLVRQVLGGRSVEGIAGRLGKAHDFGRELNQAKQWRPHCFLTQAEREWSDA